MLLKSQFFVGLTIAFLGLFSFKSVRTSSIRECQRSMLNRCRYTQRESRLYQIQAQKYWFDKSISLVCPSEFDNKTVEEIKTFFERCRYRRVKDSKNIEYHNYLTIIVESTPRWPIINTSIGFFNYFNSPEHLQVPYSIVGFRGLDIDSRIPLKYQLWLTFQNGFNLYKNNRRVLGCEDFISKSGFTFQPITSGLDLTVERSNSKRPVCSLFFRNATIDTFYIHYMIDSLYLKNMLTFTDPTHGDVNNINSKINMIIGERVFGIDVDSKFLNPHVFFRVKMIVLAGKLNSIETNVFKPFRNLRYLRFNHRYILPLIQKQGIEWMKAINSNISVDLSNQIDIQRHMTFYFRIACTNNRDLISNKNGHYFNDEDFCLFADFPFRQFVFIDPDPDEFLNSLRNNSKYTCTELWLFQFYQITKNDNKNIGRKLNASNFTACQFRERLDLCQKSNFNLNLSKSIKRHVTSFEVFQIFDLVTIILVPIVSILGIVTNFITILVIINKKNEKTMREKHYLYMCLYCFSNILICLTQIVNLVCMCQVPFGFFCSSIRRVEFIQYVKIIFGEYLNNAFRLFSNFAYFAFSICRLARIGKDHSRLIHRINDLSIKEFIVFPLIFSAGLAVCKPFQFKIQITPLYSYYNSFPLSIYQYLRDWHNYSSYIVIYVFNFIFNTINYFLFVFIHLLVDVMLIKKLVRVLGEKEEKMREMQKSMKEIEEASKENEESKRRTVFMVVLNSTLSFLTRAPLMVISFNDMRLLVDRPYFQAGQYIQTFLLEEFATNFSFKHTCVTVNSCLLLYAFGNCLYLFSFATILSFLKRFDKNFKKAYEDCFARRNKRISPNDNQESIRR